MRRATCISIVVFRTNITPAFLLFNLRIPLVYSGRLVSPRTLPHNTKRKTLACKADAGGT